MSTEDLSESLAAELTGSVGMDDVGNDMPENLAADLADQQQYEAERDIPVSNDVQDTAQGELDREAEQEQTQQRGRKVPLAALHEERQKRQALELQLQAQAQQMQQWQAQMQAQQQATQQAQQEAEAPDFDMDPKAWLDYKEAQINARFEQLQNGPAQQPQVQQVETQVLQEAAVLGPVVSDAEARFEAANPDYRQAFDHVMATVEQNMRAQHPGINEQQLGMLRTAALVTLTKQCQANGTNPAEHVYQRAQAMGYKPASREPRKQPNTSLSTLPGSARAPDERSHVSVSDISDMSEAEFDKFFNDMKRSSTTRPAY
ncbi:hypothetical protein [Pseudomonas sp. P1.8]|uniref:hypothetical protein n=1 Tax=Pseudomonas sp. P1.8 TaxID=1699310 RepID=UPI00069FD138|nr:hypothetical protein [Pseudomonas sp. P1.8]